MALSKRRLFVSGLLLLTVLVVAATVRLRRPPCRNHEVNLFQGVTYRREVRTEPRLLVVHIVEIDLTSPGIGFFVTPGDDSQGRDVPARTTSEFLEEFQLQLAVNGGYFGPFRSNGPFDFYPRSGEPVDVKGLAISNARTYSDDETWRGVFCVCDGRPQIRDDGCPPDTTHAVAGNYVLVKNGKVVFHRDRDEVAPRTAVALDAAGERMWLLVVDGRQTGYSLGVTREELGRIAVELGADTALNLDGGGSTTLAMETESGPRVLNAPYHTHIFMRERPVGNHLGIFARPIASNSTVAAGERVFNRR